MMDNSTKCVLMIGAFLFFLVYILPNLNKNTFVNSEEPQDATKPYGESIPSSMKQNRETLVKSGKDKGKINPKGFYISNCTPFDDKSFNSQFAGFEPNSKGGYDLNGYSILNNKNNNKNNNNNNNNNNKIEDSPRMIDNSIKKTRCCGGLILGEDFHETDTDIPTKIRRCLIKKEWNTPCTSEENNNCCGTDKCVSNNSGGHCENKDGYHYYYNEEGERIYEEDYIDNVVNKIDDLLIK